MQDVADLGINEEALRVGDVYMVDETFHTEQRQGDMNWRLISTGNLL
jgi:hypothetical protein